MTPFEFCLAVLVGAFIGMAIAALIIPPLLALFGLWLDFWGF
jgi:hypothetical protein